MSIISDDTMGISSDILVDHMQIIFRINKIILLVDKMKMILLVNQMILLINPVEYMGNIIFDGYKYSICCVYQCSKFIDL